MNRDDEQCNNNNNDNNNYYYYYYYYFVFVGRDSSVGISTSYGLKGPESE
jgi:hypothetical protein